MSLSAEGGYERIGSPRDSGALRAVFCALFIILAYGCGSTTPPVPPVTEVMKGVASWYGEEFAGRTTANGEIFDPAQFTAAHRTLPFGTILDVTNHVTGQTVRVRVNDRGPYIGGRVLDLSYAAAQKISLIDPGVGEVEFLLVKVGSGDREPPVPFEAIVAVSPVTASNRSPVPVPVPVAAATQPGPAPAPIVPPVAESTPKVEPVVVDRVEVQIERAGVVTRTQVAADGRTLEEVPVSGAAGEARIVRSPRAPAPSVPRPATPSRRKQFVVQVGAFSVEANARALQERLQALGQEAHIDRVSLYRVRIGPFATRDQAVATRATLEANGMSAIIVAE